MLQAPSAPLSVVDAAQARRSIRRYTSDPIPREDLLELLEAVSLAPSAFNVQPWRFVVVEDAALKAKLAEAAFNQPQVTAAPAVIALYADVDDMLRAVPDTVHPGLDVDRRLQAEQQVLGILQGFSEAERGNWAATQTNIALGFLLLTASSLGYATSTMGGFNADAVKSVLGLPASARVNALVAIGRGAEDGYPHHRLPMDRLVSFR
ncbi:MAG: nitroreductase family protein [Gemmatimonadaceae bacterium]